MTVCLPICFEERVSLSPEERLAVDKLIEECRTADHFDPCMEFDTHLNADHDLPAWRLAWAVPSGTPSCQSISNSTIEPRGGLRILAGAACAFAPRRSEGEISACVQPVFRHQGIFRELYRNLSDALFRSGTGAVLLVCEGASPSGMAIAGRLGATLDHGEFLMQLPPSQLARIRVPEGLRLIPVSNIDIYEFTALSVSIFGNTLEDARSFAIAILADPAREQYVARTSEGAVGLVAISREGQGAMLHGLGVVPEYRGRGIGGAILDACLIVLRNRGMESVSLEVDVDNEAALALYRSRGFVEVSRADYWRVHSP